MNSRFNKNRIRANAQSYIRIVNSKSEEDLQNVNNQSSSQGIISSEDVYGNNSFYQHRYGDGSLPENDNKIETFNRDEAYSSKKRKTATI